MIIVVVVAVVLLAVAACFVYKAKTKKAVVRSEKKGKLNGEMTENPMSSPGIHGSAGDPDGVLG
jgi:hypothetical protein